MKKRGISLLLCAAMALGAGMAHAEDAGTTYVFPYEGMRYTQGAGETVLTQTNLDDHAELIGQLGTTKEAILASYIASGIVMEVIPDDGGQIAVSVADAGDFADVMSMDEADAGRIALFAKQFEDSGLYESCEILQTQPACVRLTSSAMYGSMPVYSLKYATLNLGRLYMFTQTIVGREPDETDDARMEAVIARVQMLSSIPQTTPEPAATPAPTPTGSPVPTPGVAEVISRTGNMEIYGMPAFTTQADITVMGKTDASAKVSVAVDDRTLGTTVAKEDGSFALRVTLPQAGEMTLAVMTDSAETMLGITYAMPQPRFEFLELESTGFTGSTFTVRGQTEPGASVRVSGEGISDVAQANKSGVFTVRLRFDAPGTKDVTFTVRAEGFGELAQTVTFTREQTEREFIADFRKKMIEPEYDDVAKAPQDYAGKQFIFRGKIMEFTDFDGSPCALVCVVNPRQGVWQGPYWIVLQGNEQIAVGDIMTFYLVGEALTLPADGQYTASGQVVEAPVARSVYSTTNK